MNQIKNQSQIKKNAGSVQKELEINLKEDLKKRLEIMKLYTSRNNDSKSLLKNINEVNQKSSNLSLKQLPNFMTSSRNVNDQPLQASFDKNFSHTQTFLRPTNSQTSLANIKGKVDQRNINSPGKKIFQNNADNKSSYTMLGDIEKQTNSIGMQILLSKTPQNQKRSVKSQQFSNKIINIAQGSDNSQAFMRPSDLELASPQSYKQNMSSTLKMVPQLEQNTSSYLFQSTKNANKVKHLNLSNLKTFSIPNLQSNQKEIDQLKSVKSINNYPLQIQQNQLLQSKKLDKSIEMAYSHQSTNYYNQMSPSSRSGYNNMKENLTTQESNNGDFGSDPIISDRILKTDTFQKRNTLKSLKVITKKDKFTNDDDTSIYNQSVRFKTEGNEYEKSKKNFLQNITKIMKKQTILEQQKEKQLNQKKLTKTEINVFKKRNKGKKMEEMSPKSQMNLLHLIKLKTKATKLHQNVSNSFNSSNLESGDDEIISLNSDSILTEELENVELYKKRLKAQQTKFHKLHLKRLTMPQRKNSNSSNSNEFLDFLFSDDSPTKKQKKINAILAAQKEKTESYNVFGQYNDFSRQLQQKFKETIHRLRPSRDIIKYVEIESKKIHHKITTMNTEKNIEMHKMSYRNLAETTINAIQKMIPLFEEGMRQVNDRNSLDDVLNRIQQESMKTKNLVVQILCSRAFAKISKLNKNYSKSIELYKQCKNCAEIPMLFNYRLSSYKNLGYCFSHLKMHDFAMFYFCKMLRISWYQNDHDSELKAYDLIGMQYYYQGKLEIAQYYHNKMIQGQYEKEDSDMRRLGISKIDNQLRQIEDGATFNDTRGTASSNVIGKKGNQKSNKLRQMRQDPDQSCDFDISSESEENFELPIPAKSYQEQTLKDNPNQQNDFLNAELLQNQEFSQEDDQELEDSREIDRNNLIKLSLKQRKFKKNQPLFYHKDNYQLKSITEQANKNIHIGAAERDKKLIQIVPKKNINASSFKQIKGCTKIPYRINHLSVNRELENYQSIDGRITRLKQFNFNEQMYDQYEKPVKMKIKTIFENLRDNLLFAMSQLEMQVQKQKSPTKRKGAFIINPQYGQEIILQNNNRNSVNSNNYTITLTQDQ